MITGITYDVHASEFTIYLCRKLTKFLQVFLKNSKKGEIDK